MRFSMYKFTRWEGVLIARSTGIFFLNFNIIFMIVTIIWTMKTWKFLCGRPTFVSIISCSLTFMTFNSTFILIILIIIKFDIRVLVYRLRNKLSLFRLLLSPENVFSYSISRITAFSKFPTLLDHRII